MRISCSSLAHYNTLYLLMYQELLREIGQGHIADAYLNAEEEQRKQLEAQRPRRKMLPVCIR